MTAQLQQQQQPHASGDCAKRLVRVEKDVPGLTAGLASLTGSVERGFAALTSNGKVRHHQPTADRDPARRAGLHRHDGLHLDRHRPGRP